MSLRTSLRLATVVFLGVAVFALAIGCSDDDDGDTTGSTGNTGAATGATGTGSTGTGTGATGGTNGGDLSGSIGIDGSSTVFPITEAVSEEFLTEAPRVQAPVGLSGTGGGFERFCAGETDISNASRPISQTDEDEVPACTANGIEYIEIPVAYDGLSVVINPQNDWVTCITVEQLNQIWAPEAEGTITRWNQVDPSWPDAPFVLYGPGTDSGTFDYFTGTVNGEEGASRTDFTPSEDDNVLVQGVAGDENALGYFGLAYLEENQGTIKGLEVDGGEGCVAPSAETVESGEYAPLSRPLFIYVNADSVDKPQVKAYVDFYLESVPELAPDVGYVPFPAEYYEVITERWTSGTTGSIFSGVDGSVGEILGVN